MSKNSDKYQKITYYKLPENYHYFEDVDVTKFDSLTGDEIDANFFVLEGRDIQSIDVVRDEDDEMNRIVVTLVSGEVIESENPFPDFIETLSFDYDKEDGVLTVCINDCDHEPLKVEGFLTMKDVLKIMNDFCVYTDGSITGDGSLDSPLSIPNSQKTGMVKPINDINLLPDNPTIGDRYITYESIDNVGRFYNFDGIFDIMEALEEEGEGWRVASKHDWDGILNYLEPKPVFKDHNRPSPSKWLGQVANVKLKAVANFGLQYCGYVFDDDEKSVSFKDEKASFWCATNTMGKPLTKHDTQAWVKQFKGGDHPDGRVYQTLVDNAIYSSIRLVKDIETGETAGAAEILGTVYPTTIMRSADGKNKLWISVNLDYDTENNNSFKDESALIEKPYINEWDGEKWIKFEIEPYTTFMLKAANALYYIDNENHIKPVDGDAIERIADLEREVEEMSIMIANYHKSVRTKLEEAHAYVYDPEYEYKGEFVFGEDSIDYRINAANIGEGGRNIMNDFARLLGGLYRTNQVESIQFNYKYYDWDDEEPNKGSNYKEIGVPCTQPVSLVTAIVAAYQVNPTQVFKIKFDNTVVNTTITVVNE